MTELLCPGCGLRLTQGRLGPAGLDYCPACRGVWLGTAALRELLIAGEEAVRRLQEQVGAGDDAPCAHEPAGGCPSCDTPLAKIVAPDLPQTPVFACTWCRGFWLTAAALNQLVSSRSAQSHVAAAQPGPTPGAPPDCED